jgi:uncharacterized protein (TIGR03086 family)
MAPTDRFSDVTELIDVGRDREAAEQGARPRTPAGVPMDVTTQLELLGPHLGRVVAGITADQLDTATPCADFDVRGVLEHMIGGATAFAAAFRGETPREHDLGDPLGSFAGALGDLVASITAPGALDRTIAAPFGTVPGETFARFVVLDGLVHGWDLATATGQPYEPPAELVEAVDEFAHQVLDGLRDGGAFAAPVTAPADATGLEQLVAYTGRRPEPAGLHVRKDRAR